MKKPSDAPGDWDAELARIVGLGAHSVRKSHYPELRRRLAELEAANQALRAEVARREQAEAALRDSERRYRRIVETSLEGIIAVDADTRINFVNQRVSALLGYAPDELLNRPVSAFMVPEELADHEQRMRNRRAGLAECYERRYRCRSGETVLLLTSATPQYDDAGQFRGSLAMLTDITAREQAGQALRESETRLRTLINAMPDIVCFKDGQGRWLEANEFDLRLFQLEDVEYRGKKDSELAAYSPFYRTAFLTCEDSDEVAWRARGISRGDEVIPSPDSPPRVFDILKVPTFNPDGTRQGLIVVGRDITERRRAEAALQENQAILLATLESTQDGILVVARDGSVSHSNARFAELWSIPPGQLALRDDRAWIEYVRPQLRDPDAFVARIQQLYGTAERSGDTVLLRDGRILERWSAPLIRDGQQQGRVWFFRDVTASHQAQQALQASELRFRSVFEQCPIGIAVYDADGRVVSANHAALDIFGMPDLAAAAGWRFFDDPNLPPDAVPRLRAGETVRFDVHYDGAQAQGHGMRTVLREARDLDVIFTPLRPAPDQPIQGFVLLAQDFTERKRLEAQLLQAQKMEAVGQLAGGVAHDFNNILTAILGNAELAQSRLVTAQPAVPAAVEGLQQIERSALRAAELTRQLLAFSRRQVVQPRVVQLDEALREMEKMLRRVLTENITLALRHQQQLWPVRIDPGQFEQVVTNLVVNARDAMPTGGLLALETRNTILDTEYAQAHPDAHAGPHVVLVVSDTGTGIPAPVLQHIFEPFYTTKPFGRGTGLGLAMVYGIVRQAGGHITVYSEPGHGTAFRVYLPATVDAAVVAPAPAANSAAAPVGTETILLCEDDQAVRELAALVLQHAGYAVLSAARGAQTVALAKAHTGAIQLLVTDVIMPDTNGRELAEQVRAARPGLRVLFISGYTADVIAHHGVLDAGVEFLEKPFSRQSLLQRVREVLDGPLRVS
jgi:two-component system cell cycle sensor histidine kinase/response regulator CckA